jgi:hypothetical protein
MEMKWNALWHNGRRTVSWNAEVVSADANFGKHYGCQTSAVRNIFPDYIMAAEEEIWFNGTSTQKGHTSAVWNIFPNYQNECIVVRAICHAVARWYVKECAQRKC